MPSISPLQRAGEHIPVSDGGAARNTGGSGPFAMLAGAEPVRGGWGCNYRVAPTPADRGRGGLNVRRFLTIGFEPMLGMAVSTVQGAGDSGGEVADGSRGLILLVDDEPTIVRGFARILGAAGFSVQVAHDGREAADLARSKSFDVIVSDIAMPEMTGLQLLRSVREHDLDVPVILMTGGPAVESAVQAMEYGALRYLIKPVDSKQLEEVVARATRLHQMAKIKREALELFRLEGKHLGDRAGLEVRFANAIKTLWLAYQPIISWSDRSVIAYEALVRNEEPTLRAPPDLFEAAERLGRLRELGRIIC